MYFATTDAYATGSQNALVINELGNITVTRGSFTASGNTILGTTAANTLTVNATAAFNSNTTIGDASTDTLTVNATSTLTSSLSFQQPLIGSQNQYVRVGNAFFSSGGNFTQVANNEWFNGTSWVTTNQAGALYQQAAQNHNWFRHDGAGNHTTLMTLDSNGNLTITGSLGTGSGLSVSGSITATGDITAFFTSDRRLKNNISPIADALNKVNKISGNTFEWNENSGKTGNDVGVIAQEIAEVIPEAVVERDNGYLAVRYELITPLLIEAVKELTSKVENLEHKLNNK
jgi:hypothetical protein